MPRNEWFYEIHPEGTMVFEEGDRAVTGIEYEVLPRHADPVEDHCAAFDAVMFWIANPL